MFLVIPGVTIDDRYRDLERAMTREAKPASRIQVQRHLLEHNKMYHLNSMLVDDRALDRERDLARRQLIAQAFGRPESLTSKARRSLGGALISIGERIRPQFVQGEPKFNG